MLKIGRRSLAAGVATLALLAAAPAVGQGKVLKFVQNGNLTILDPVKNKALAVAVQNRMLETAQYGWLGIWYGPGASQSNVVGWLKAPVVVHWNIEKK